MASRAGPPLLFVHGFLGEAADWDRMRALLGTDVGAACFELPGHGAAPPVAATAGSGPERWFPAAAERLRDACVAQGTPPVLIGYSMGGRLALYTAVRFPRAAGGLVVIGADPGIEDAEARAERATRDEALARQLAAAGDADAFAGWLQRWYAAPLFGGLRRRAEFDALLRRRLRGRPASLAAALRGLSVAVQPALWEALPRLPMPALFIAGAEDAKYRAVAGRIAELGAPWQAAVCPGAAHAVHLEQPEAVAGLIRSFARSLATGAAGTTDKQPD
jgi:2-succinyl-6-hydroxy-2,4-cyclohexadiene-1-carboxylate synthase